MKKASARPRTISLARRALIVQRILVDGWTSAEAAAASGVSERQVDIWLAEFQRDGMRSLRRTARRTLPAERIYLAISRPVRRIYSIAVGLRRLLVRERLPNPSPLERLNDDRRSLD